MQPLASDIPDNQLAMIIETHDARSEEVAQGIGEYPGLFAIPRSHEAVGGAQVDTNDHSHFSLNDAAKR
ncbi:NAD-specific glutamate dehydrogenase [compost metagenome]